MKGPEPTEETVPLGKAAVVREGSDITIVSALRGVRDALEAAEELAGDGIDAEVVDIRSLRPLDHETVLESVARTNRVMLVEEGTRVGGWAGEPARHHRRGGAARPRRRLDRRHGRHAGSLQPHARGRLATRRRRDRGGRARAPGRGRPFLSRARERARARGRRADAGELRGRYGQVVAEGPVDEAA